MTNKTLIKLDKYDVRDIIYLLDIQRGYCVDGGADVPLNHLWIPTKRKYSAELKRQISYYNGHVNAIEKLLSFSGALLAMENGRHTVYIDGEEV